MTRATAGCSQRSTGLCIVFVLLLPIEGVILSSLTASSSAEEPPCPAVSSCLAGVEFATPGDADCDGDVSSLDLELLIRTLFCDACPECRGKDANEDGTVSAADLTALVAVLAEPVPAPTATPTPAVTNPVPSATPLPEPDTPTPSPTEEPTPQATSSPAANDETVATTVYDSTRFLYEGAGAPQTGVTPGTIEPARVALVRGRVLDRAGRGFPGVTVTVLNCPEFGRTTSDGAGNYALAVNGGGQLTIDFRKDGFVTVQRQLQPAWQDWAVVDDIVMTPLDTEATPIDLSGNTTAWQVHRSSMQSDVDGTRRAMLLFPPAVTGELLFADGSTAALARCAVRVTEVTVGPMGEAAMPAELPPTSNYTYAASVDCDEALAAGTEHTEFSPSLPLYVENFLGFPIGIEVPYGVYDSARGVWEGEPNGVVLRVTSITGQMADLDLDSGDGGDAQADPELYATYGISDGERATLAGLSAPGMEYWRVQVRRFSKGDLNWSALLPAGAGGAPGGGPSGGNAGRRLTDKGPRQSGFGTIEPEEQVFHEDIGLVGLPFTLHYTSRRQPGRTAEYEVRVPITDATPPAPLEKVVTELRVAGRVIQNEWTNAPNQTVTLSWDGLDAFGRPVVGRQKAEVRIGYVYVPQFVRGLAFAVPRSEVLRQGRGGQRLTVWTTQRVALGEVGTEAAGLGGWTPSILHTYDPVGRTLHLGDGTVRSVEGTVLASEELVSGGDLPDRIFQVLADRDGSVVFLELSAGEYRIRRYRPDTGAFEVIAGGGTDFDPDDGGAPALSTQILVSTSTRQAIALGADGSVYWAESLHHRVRRVRNGVVETVAGAYAQVCQPATDRFNACGDGGAARGPSRRQRKVHVPAGHRLRATRPTDSIVHSPQPPRDTLDESCGTMEATLQSCAPDLCEIGRSR
ncbi:MAG: hypothetical protein KatS3mg077_1323 [Candidatus Binatia bacterium]|nr:MAG: hypothetical protein KatS3mg077_1323 [Candidatus Binatia bacterium]